MESVVLARISATRDAEKKMAETEERRKQMSLRRRADTEKRKQEEAMEAQRRVLQLKREEFLEQKRKKQQINVESSPESTSPTADVSNASTVSPTYENVQVDPPVPIRAPYHLVQDGILTPQPAVKNSKGTSSPEISNPLQPTVSGQNQIWEDFEDKELDPFTNAELQTINDLAVLETVLKNAKMGQAQAQNGTGCETSKVYENIEGTLLPNSTGSNSKVICENVPISEVNRRVASSRSNQMQSLTANTQPFNNHQMSDGKAFDAAQPLYAKVEKRRPNGVENNQDQSDPVCSTFSLTNPFAENFGQVITVGAADVQSQPNLVTPTGQNTFSPVYNTTPIEPTNTQSVILANMFDPVSTGYFPSPVFPRSTTSQNEVPCAMNASQSNASKVLPVSFGATNNSTSSVIPENQSSTLQNLPKQPQSLVKKPPMPAPRKPAIPARRTPITSPSTRNHTQSTETVENGLSKGRTHRLPPYSLPTNEDGATSTSVESGFIHKSKHDRAKFAETVNKALSSLPQNPKPVKKVPPVKQNVESQTPTITRTLSLKSSLIAGLTSDEQTFVKNMMSMGFEGEATVRAMQRFGLDDKEVVDHLIQVQSIVEQGYSSGTVQDALEMFPSDGKSVAKYLQHIVQFMDMGFPEDMAREALKSHNNDQAHALDQLMGAT